MAKQNETIETLTAKACKCSTKGAKGGFTMEQLTSALNAGLGIRKKDWKPGYFVYFNKDGVLMNGQLARHRSEDKPRVESFEFCTDPAAYEIVDRSYILLRNVVKKLVGQRGIDEKLHMSGELDSVVDAKMIERVAKALKIDVDSYGC